MKIKFLGHACFLVEVNGTKLLFDPFISGNELAKDINIDEIEADYILISHGHEDHILDAEYIAKKNNAKIVSNFEIVNWFGAKGVDGHPMNIGGKWKFDFGTVKYVNAIHSSQMPDGQYAGNPGGFLVDTNEGAFYYAGDTALTYDMKLIPLFTDNLKFSILPLGDNFTMSYEDAIFAADFVKCTKIIGCHYDTFGYIEIDHSQVQSAFKNAGLDLSMPKIGEEIEI